MKVAAASAVPCLLAVTVYCSLLLANVTQAKQHFQYVAEHPTFPTRDDSNPSGALTPQESKKRLLLLLIKMDKNADEVVDPHELFHWIVKSMKQVSREKSDRRLALADTDGNGLVTWEEHFGIIKTGQPSNKQEQDKELFALVDADKDGSLTAEEYNAFAYPGEHPALLPTLLQQTMLAKDADSDGKLSFKEYIHGSVVKKDGLYARQLAERERFDAMFDDNGNGYMDPSEVTEWLRVDHHEIARDETNDLLRVLDEDLDRKLSFTEIMTNRKAFHNSEATDWGQHLINMDRFPRDEL